MGVGMENEPQELPRHRKLKPARLLLGLAPEMCLEEPRQLRFMRSVRYCADFVNDL
jgi:hypothetical protein